MRDLRFVSLDDTGERLVLRDDEQEYAVDVDEALVQATRRAHGWHGRDRTTTHTDGQAERVVDTKTEELRPRDIQARVRAGESPAQVATSEGVDVERVARFARPVLQEREHIATSAQSVVVRTGALDGPLGEVVEDRLAHLVAEQDLLWDAWRREDGRWTVALTFRDDVQQRSAHWSFDPTTNSVTVDDETARWLTEGTTPPTGSATPLAEKRSPRGRRLLSVPDLPPESARETSKYDEAEIADELAALGIQPVVETVTAVSALDDDGIAGDIARTNADAQSDEQTELDIPAEQTIEAPAKPAKKRKASKRASVPSWDDIVFGARKPTE